MQWRALGVAAAFLGFGCLGSSPASRFYTLSTLPPPGSGSGAATRTIRVAPVSLPEALERPQLVRRTGATTVSIEEFDRWVEPLDTLLRNALALDLAALLPDAQVLGGSAPGLEVQQTVVVAVARLDVAQELSIDAVWFILPAGADQPRTTHRARLTETAGAGQASDVAAALSRAVEHLSRDIAAELQASPPPASAIPTPGK
jgi:uncharacterized protein